MPLLDIAIAQPSFHNHWGSTRLQLCVNGKATNCSLLQYEERWASFSIFFQNPGKIKIHLGHQRKLHPKFLVKAVATFDPKISVQSEDGGEESNASLSIDESVSSTVHTESSDADSEEIDTREKLRRMGISKVYRGTWNKGGKRSPETLQRTRERTKLALQDPKVRMKLARSCPQLSQEARDNISAGGLRMVWKQHYQRLETQLTCLFDWQNLIAEAARGGFDEEEELQWDSFEILEKQLQEEWLERLEYMKTTPRPKTDNRASKTLEKQRKVSEAIADKGADPEYQARVPSGSVKYYGTPTGTKRRMKMKLSRVGRCRRNSWSQEVKDKIGSGLRKAWKRRLQRLQNQATCLFDWQNLIAEAAREGFDEDELQWDSYEILEKQLQQEWLERMEYMRATPQSKTTNRAMTLEERRKISEGMAAKWADPEYRARVSSGLVKYYGTPEGTERRMKMKLSRLGQSRRNSRSREARDNISAGLRKAWKRRRQRLETQATCLFDWQILIAEAAREGFDEDQLQWDSYEILEKQLRQEWLERMEYRKTTPQPKTANRAPLTLEERRKFPEEMAAKWADPEYRARFSSGLLKYYGTPEGTERRMKTKLSCLGQSRRNSRSQETRDKISAGLRKAWKRSRQRLETQATCLFDWQNLIAEAAREGFHEEELQWDSYESLEKQLQQEWLESMEYGKTTPRPKTGSRAPKTLEERRKISEAISGGQSKRTRRIKVGDAEGSSVNELKAGSRQAKLKKEYVPKYNDPLASSKLEMLKSIRAQRVASQTKTNETLEQAKVLMAEARKAVKALELVAMKSPVAQASLIEARKLIAEVTQTIEKIENGKVGSLHDAASVYHQNHVERSGNGARTKDPSDEHPIGINAIAYLESIQGHNPDFNLYRWTMLDNTYMSYHRSMRLGGYKFRGLENVDPATTQFGPHETEVCPDRDVRSLTSANRKIDSVKVKQEFEQGNAVERLDLRALMDQRYHNPEPNGIAKLNGTPAPSGSKVHVHEAPAAKIVTKRWVCGRLVEVVEGE